MVDKHKLRKKRNFRNYGKSNKELNDLIEKKTNVCEEQEKEENGKRSQTLSGNADFCQQDQ